MADDKRSRTVVLIPARLAATRLPDKPLLPIAGVPMIVHVWRRAVEADLGPVVVACAEQVIADAVRAAGGEAVLTDPALPSGTDRIHQALGRLDPERRYELVVNVQGDLPVLEPAALRRVVEPIRLLGTDMGTLASPTEDEEERANPNVVKAVASFTEDDPDARPRPLLHPCDGTDRPGAGLAPYRHLRLHPRRAGALRRPAAQPARAARAAGAVAGPGERHDHRRPPRRHGAVRRRHPGRPRAGARHPGAASLTTTDTGPAEPERTIAFQGVPGAYSHMACRQALPELLPLPCHSSRTRSRPCARAGPGWP